MSLFESGLLSQTKAGKISLIDAFPKSIAEVILQHPEFHRWEYSYSILLSQNRFPQLFGYINLDYKNRQLYDRATFKKPNETQGLPVMSSADTCNEENHFVYFRRKVRAAEVLSSSMEQLLKAVRFSGRISVIVQNGRVLKSGYEEGFFRQRPAGSPLEPIEG